MEQSVEPIRLTFYHIALMGAALGFILGLFPLVLGFFKSKLKIGLLGLLGSTIGGAILGVFLSIPVIAVCIWLILKKPKNSPVEVVVMNDNPISVKVEDADNR